MASIVFILGAGASKQAGAPLMMEFLDVAHDLWKTGKVSQADASFAAVFNGISALQRVHSKSQLDIQNVESVFAAFEMAKTLGKFVDYTPEQIDALVGAMRSVIVSTIEKTLLLPVSHRTNPPYGGAVLPPAPYDYFAELVKALLQDTNPKQTVAVVTFNYDMAVDFTFNSYSIPVYYGLEEHRSRYDVPLLKLHGSLNWAQCKNCGNVIPWHLDQYFSTFSWNFLRDQNSVVLPIGSQLSHFMHCDQSVIPEPVVVPPTWNKAEYHRILSRVWSEAAHELGEAESIFVIGYSLPLSDTFFRYLYALGTVGQVILKRFWVFNPDTSDAVKTRFQELLGPGASQRFRYLPLTFGQSFKLIFDEFRLPYPPPPLP